MKISQSHLTWALLHKFLLHFVTFVTCAFVIADFSLLFYMYYWYRNENEFFMFSLLAEPLTCFKQAKKILEINLVVNECDDDTKKKRARENDV